MMGMHLVIPRLQKSLNVLLRQHWTKIRGTKGCEQEVFDILVKKAYQKYKPMGFKGMKVKIIYTLYFPTKVKHDYSNYAQKMLDDSLVKCGIIDDDNSDVIIEETLRIKYDKVNPRTEIDILEASF